MGLTLLQQRFCEELMVDGHQTNAAIRAGSPPAGAAVWATRALKKANVQNYIAELRAKLSAATGVSLERTLQEIAKVAYIDPSLMYNKETGELLPLHQMPPHVRAAVAGIDTIELPGGVGNIKKVKLTDKAKALDMLMKHHGGYEMDNKQKQATVNLIIDIVDDDEPLPTDQPAETELPDTDFDIDDDDE